jgi:hypothetical protein
MAMTLNHKCSIATKSEQEIHVVEVKVAKKDYNDDKNKDAGIPISDRAEGCTVKRRQDGKQVDQQMVFAVGRAGNSYYCMVVVCSGLTPPQGYRKYWNDCQSGDQNVVVQNRDNWLAIDSGLAFDEEDDKQWCQAANGVQRANPRRK